MPDRPFLNRDDVAAIGAEVQGAPLQPKTISQHMYESRPEVGRDAPRPGKFADDPFPAPDGYLGKAPWWDKGREQEIRGWFERHPRRVKGDGIGGRPRAARPNG